MCVLSDGWPPRDTSQITTMLLNVQMVPSSTAGVSTGRICGTVTLRNRCHAFAPSSSAASYNSCGTADSPPRHTIIMNGNPSHTLTRIGATNAQNGSVSHGTAGRCSKRRRIRFTAPYS